MEEAGSAVRDEDTFIGGLRCIADLCGSERAEYYNNPVKGLHYQHSFTEQWDQSYSRQYITLWDQDFRRQCPSGYSSDFKDGNMHWTSTLQEDIP